VAEQATLVRFEPCPWYADDGDDSLAACVHCGWLEADHLTQVEASVGEAGWARRAERLAS
jgi:hypothetical protein